LADDLIALSEPNGTGSVLGLRLGCGSRFRRRQSRAGTLADSREHFQPMPERYADVLEVLIAQMAEYGNIDLILGKALGVLATAAEVDAQKRVTYVG
jgi:hypothetical protein